MWFIRYFLLEITVKNTVRPIKSTYYQITTYVIKNYARSKFDVKPTNML